MSNDLVASDKRHIEAFLAPKLPIDGMTQQQVNFVDQLIIHKGNQTQAYLAVYTNVKKYETAAAAASRLLKNVKVQRFLAFRLQQLREAQMTEVHQQRVIQELNRLAFSSPADIMKWDADGNVTVKAAEELDDHQLATIKRIRCVKVVKRTKDGDEYETTTVELEQHDKKGALDILSRASKLVDNSKPTVPVHITLNFSSDKPQPKVVKEVN